MFAPFTRDEVEAVRSIVLMGQQQDDMLLSNCSTRPLSQTRSFIRRFKRVLLDSQASVIDITKSANEQYVSIIAGVRMKRGGHHRMPNATSLSNLASPLFNSIKTVPFKFRSKYGKSEAEPEPAPALPPPLPTRSRSVSEGLTVPEIPPKKPETTIPVLPPISTKIYRACESIDDVDPGQLVAIWPAADRTMIFCRVLARRVVNGEGQVLVGFFQPDIGPCFVRPQQVVKLRPSEPTDKLPDPLTVDAIIEQIGQEGQALVMDLSMPTGDPAVQQQQSSYVMYRSLACAVQLLLLSFAAHYKVPRDKLDIMYKALSSMNPPKYASSVQANEKCRELVQQILQRLY